MPKPGREQEVSEKERRFSKSHPYNFTRNFNTPRRDNSNRYRERSQTIYQADTVNQNERQRTFSNVSNVSSQSRGSYSGRGNNRGRSHGRAPGQRKGLHPETKAAEKNNPTTDKLKPAASLLFLGDLESFDIANSKIFEFYNKEMKKSKHWEFGESIVGQPIEFKDNDDEKEACDNLKDLGKERNVILAVIFSNTEWTSARFKKVYEAAESSKAKNIAVVVPPLTKSREEYEAQELTNAASNRADIAKLAFANNSSLIDPTPVHLFHKFDKDTKFTWAMRVWKVLEEIMPLPSKTKNLSITKGKMFGFTKKADAE